ncbi:MaoC family dehydratase [Fundicoccus culcitae]|uniref:MaoC family dehydratase n=1 Tax=Fundicoccus culcitae TaxID=2969821 RepID=A0ABY5P4E5_9LACT|nr:MaoC family dehydratase [Fundicoccus culcitae]UUX33419.1 MaoC family dehydratase [Fundicoccus culcitae]
MLRELCSVEDKFKVSNSYRLQLKDLVVGDVYQSGSYAISKEDIIEFAQMYDPQFYHVDEEVANKRQFGGLIASGWHTAAITMGLFVRTFQMENGMIGAMVDLSWPNPTRPGDIIQPQFKILDIRPSKSKPYQAIVTVEWDVKNDADLQLMYLTTKIVMYYEDPTPHQVKSDS